MINIPSDCLSTSEGVLWTEYLVVLIMGVGTDYYDRIQLGAYITPERITV